MQEVQLDVGARPDARQHVGLAVLEVVGHVLEAGEPAADVVPHQPGALLRVGLEVLAVEVAEVAVVRLLALDAELELLGVVGDLVRLAGPRQQRPDEVGELVAAGRLRQRFGGHGRSSGDSRSTVRGPSGMTSEFSRDAAERRQACPRVALISRSDPPETPPPSLGYPSPTDAPSSAPRGTLHAPFRTILGRALRPPARRDLRPRRRRPRRCGSCRPRRISSSRSTTRAGFVERITKLDAVEKFQTLAAVKEQLDATTPRRLRQLLAYFEKKLGAKYPQLLDDIAGGGIAVAGTFGGKAPVLLVMQGRDEERVEKFLAEALEVLGGELKRQESKEKIVEVSFAGVPGYKVGDLLLARIGATLVAANHKDAMGKAIGLHNGKGKSLLDHPSVLEAKKLLPASPLASVWIDMKPVHASPAGKALYASPRDDVQLTVLFGGILDVLGRSPFVCAGLTLEDDALTLSIRAPKGRDGAGPDLALHMGDGKLGSRPLLEPKGVLYSSSFHLDLATFWTDRAKLFPKGAVKGFEDVEQEFAARLRRRRPRQGAGGDRPLEARRRRQRAEGPLPAPARHALPGLRLHPRADDPERFASAVGTALRFGALALTIQNGMKSVEMKHAGHAITAYRFDEKAALEGRPRRRPLQLRAVLRPRRRPVRLLLAHRPVQGTRRSARRRAEVAEEGSARDGPEPVLRLGPRQAHDRQRGPTHHPGHPRPGRQPGGGEEADRRGIRFVESLGSFDLSTLYGADRFRYDIRLRLRKDTAEARR